MMMTEQDTFWIEHMENSDEFFEELGSRIARRRKELRMTQTELGELTGTSQKVITSYETGRRHIPVWRVPAMAEVLHVSIEELLGVNGHTGKKPGPAPKLQRQIEQLKRLPKTKQKFVSEFLETVLQQA